MQPEAGVFQLCSSSWGEVTWDLFGYLIRASKGIWFLLTCSPWVISGSCSPTEADQGHGPCALSLAVMHLTSCNWAVELGLLGELQARAVDGTNRPWMKERPITDRDTRLVACVCFSKSYRYRPRDNSNISRISRLSLASC